MYFSINSYKYLIGLEDTYRLKRNENFEEDLEFKEIDSTADMLFNSYESAQLWLMNNEFVNINGEMVSTKEKEVINFADSGYSFEIIVHRVSKPENTYPTIEQVRSLLVNGDDKYNNSLIIDFDGYPRLIKLVGQAPASLRGYAARFETFGAGNGYVGSDSQLNHLEGTYQALLESWYLHLSSGKEIYRDFSTNEFTVEELIGKINREIAVLR